MACAFDQETCMRRSYHPHSSPSKHISFSRHLEIILPVHYSWHSFLLCYFKYYSIKYSFIVIRSGIEKLTQSIVIAVAFVALIPISTII